MKITCQNCEHCYELARSFSVFLQEAIEHQPCSRCGAYTLRCDEPAARKLPERLRLLERRRAAELLR